MRQLPDERDAQVGWFHDLAEEVKAGRFAFDLNTRDALGRFLGTFLPGHPLSGTETNGELEEVVRDVRENEVAWNRALQRAILEADDAYRAEGPAQALALLEAFARKCPWTSFVQIALDQSTHYGGDSVE